ncbi:hypothetical protein MYX82_13360, partial [Acidobacteria bacterium AH-259-D05]|nr:hypothetical protein [Acidobacteria bacterium AH-259-D05]
MNKPRVSMSRRRGLGVVMGLIVCLLGLLAPFSPVRAQAAPAPFVADAPARASLIQVSPRPDEAGDVTVTGAPGAVSPRSFVVLVTLDTGHFAHTQAGEDGSFSASLFAPAGTFILIKVDPLGIAVEKFLREFREGIVGALAALPGTIVFVADPSPAEDGVAFAGAGLTGADPPSSLPAWTFQGTINSQEFSPG